MPSNMPLAGFNILPLALMMAGAGLRTPNAAALPAATARTDQGETVPAILEPTGAQTPATKRALQGANLRGLLGDLAPYVPGGRQLNVMTEVMDMATRVRQMRSEPQARIASPATAGGDPLQRSIGLISALRRNIPAMDHPSLSRFEQTAGMMGMMKNSMGALGSMGGLGGLGQIGNMLQGMNQLPAAPAEPEPQALPDNNPAALAGQVSRMLGSMDEAQKKEAAGNGPGLRTEFGYRQLVRAYRGHPSCPSTASQRSACPSPEARGAKPSFR